MTATDYQRSKVYSAERTVTFDRDRPTMNIDDAQRVCDQLAAQFGVETVTVRQNRRIKQYGAWYTRKIEDGVMFPVIESPDNVMPLSVVLHEFAHHLHDAESRSQNRSWSDEAGHGGAFVAAMLRVTEAWCGELVAARLHKAYRAVSADLTVDQEYQRLQRVAAASPTRHSTRDRYAVRVVLDSQSRGSSAVAWYQPNSRRPSKLHHRNADKATTWAKRSTAEKHAAELVDKLAREQDRRDMLRLRRFEAVEVVQLTEQYDMGWYVDRIGDVVETTWID